MDMNFIQPVLIIGAGPGGSALLDIFSRESHIKVLGIVDNNQDAPGLKLARSLNVSVYSNAEDALESIAGSCMVFNTTNDPLMDKTAASYVGDDSVISGQVAKFFWHIITRLQLVKDELLENQIRLRAVIHNVREGIISITPRGTIEDANPAIEAIFGYSPGELVGQPVSMLMPEPHKTAHDSYIENYLRTGEKRVIGRYREVTARHKDGHEFPLELSANEMGLNGAKHFVGLVRDITERKIAEEKLTHLAMYDQLTGLPNRTNFFEKLSYSLTQARRNQSTLALLFIDLDGFKTINDTQGHDTGDRLLSDVANRLLGCIRESDISARIGGDEFTVLLNNLHGIEGAAMVAENIIKAINLPIVIGGVTCKVGASIGIAIYPDHTRNIDELINIADTAMYRAKSLGKNTYVLGVRKD